ncbi:MAG: CYTH domain-containing protein [Tannerellaceae bacterium]|jgi:CYTH domain-containing protein|nr:CYTH domain-containing protein [Tannerellaceae bacterium]
MELEIEKKFLVEGDFKPFVERVRKIRQAYLATTEDGLIMRVRVYDDGEAVLGLKKAVEGDALIRREFMYRIPVSDANELLKMCADGNKNIIEKDRHYIPAGKHTWEVDVFHGLNEGLVVAEIELSSPDETFERPQWLGREVTGQIRYENVMLAGIPYSCWQNYREI